MKTYTFTFSFQENKNALNEYIEDSMIDTELEVSYWVAQGRLYLCACEMEVRTCTGIMKVDMLPVIIGLGADKILKHAAEDNYEMRRQEQIFKNYPELYKNTQP